MVAPPSATMISFHASYYIDYLKQCNSGCHDDDSVVEEYGLGIYKCTCVHIRILVDKGHLSRGGQTNNRLYLDPRILEEYGCEQKCSLVRTCASVHGP